MSKDGRAIVSIQVNALELLNHDNVLHVQMHLPKGQSSFAEMIPSAELMKPETEFALINILAKIFENLIKVDPTRPEGVVLRAMTKNFVAPETAAALASGGPVTPMNPAEMQTKQFNDAVALLEQKYKNDPQKRDALRCLAVAYNRPLTTNEIFLVYRNLSDGAALTPAQWQHVVGQLVQAVQLMKTAGEDCNKKMGAIARPSVLDLANAVEENAMVNPDGTLAPRAQAAAVQKPEETVGMLEMSRDFWLAFFKAGLDAKLNDPLQMQVAQLMRNAGAMYVKTGKNPLSLQTAMTLDANAHRFLIQKLRAHPMVKADRVRMAAVEKLAQAEATGRAPTPDELAEIFEGLGRGVTMTPEMLKAVLQQMINNARLKPKDVATIQGAMASGASPAEAIRVMNQATMQKPTETVACLDLFANLFIAMHATKQNAALRDQHQRLVSETIRGAAQAHGHGQFGKRSSSSSLTAGAVDVNAYRMALMKLRAEPAIKADKAKAKAVEELAAAQVTKKDPSPLQLLEIFKELGRGVRLSPEMLRALLEYMCTTMRALTPNEKAELQKRFRQSPGSSPTDVVDETTKVREEAKEVAQQAQVVGCFQVFPEGHPGFGARPLPTTTQSRELGQRAGPASVEWHRYKALGTQPPSTEMARIVLVQSQLADVKNFDDEKTQKTLIKEASDINFKSILEPTVMGKYQQSLKGDKAALSALQGLSQVGTMDETQLGKKVDQLLTTLTIDRAQLRAVLQQMVKDRLMTNDEAKDVERRCEPGMASGGGKMNLNDLQAMLRARKGGQ